MFESSHKNFMTDNPDSQDLMTAEEKLKLLQDKWVDIIKDLNCKMKNLPSLNDLLNEVYSQRQNAVDYYYVLQKLLIKLSIEYKREFARIYNDFKLSGNSGLRYNNETALTTQIEAVLSDQKKNIQLIQSHSEYMKDTIKTIDSIIFGIGQKIKVYEMINGLKL